MIERVKRAIRGVRNTCTRTAWAIRRLGLAYHANGGHLPGLVLVQIDGLSRHEMQRALANGKLPFLRRLLTHQGYRDHPMYSGIPSNTPVVQGELFYGVRQCVPAFSYFDAATKRIFSMFEGADAWEIQSRLVQQGKPLLKGGSAYANIYDGGAEECHLCMRQLGSREAIRKAPRSTLAGLALLHVWSMVRAVALAIIEFGLAIIDLARGLIAREDFWRELTFVPARIGVCILMREIIVIRSTMDLMRGLPMVQMNFLGYDEQSHRRGPDSAFAHWSLKGIDEAIERVYKAAGRSSRRDYDLWVYSDHGQNRVVAYETVTGVTLQAAVRRVFEATFPGAGAPRAQFPCSHDDMLTTPRHRAETQPPERPPLATALGPAGCIYTFAELDAAQLDCYARALVDDASIPLLVAPDGPGRALAWTPEGRFRLPTQATEVLGEHHPHRQNVAQDLVSLCHHPDAGDFLVCGYRKVGRSLTFVRENGAHGGISARETSPFALLPEDTPLPEGTSHGLRIGDLRQAAFALLDSHTMSVSSPGRAPTAPPSTIKILTYNIHNCLGKDGLLSPHRIARVIRREQPDVICLQEVDVNRARSGHDDQAHVLAGYLTMHHEFHPALQLKDERYGDAILSRFPMTVIRADALPYRRGRWIDEPRGAIWVKLDLGGGRHVHVINTHLGIWKRERCEQAQALAGTDWLRHPSCRGPVVLCGDLNSSPGSRPCRIIAEEMRPAQDHMAGHKPKSTFPGHVPIKRLDYVFINDALEVLGVHVPRTHLARTASDHLPLVVALRIHNPVATGSKTDTDS